VIGLSIGGMIVQLLVLPSEMIDKLISDTRSKIGCRFWNARIQQVESVGYLAFQTVLCCGGSRIHSINSFRTVSGYRNMLERCSPRVYTRLCSIRDADLTDKSKRIKLPTLCIVGSEDLSTTPAEVKNLADLIEGSTFVVIQGSGHIPCVDNPKMLSNRILEFINT
jgi:3-oxoadipate enol-lactonase